MTTLPKALVEALEWNKNSQIHITIISSDTLLLTKSKKGSKLQFPNNKQYLLTLPKALVEALNWQIGKKLSFGLKDKNLILRSEP